MPIMYGPDASWPPLDVQAARPFYREWLAWWRGRPDELHSFYQASNVNHRVRPSQTTAGIGGFFSRLFWGRAVVGNQTRLHVPAAADVSMLSASMLFGDPPTMALDGTDGNKATQARLDTILQDSGAYGALHQGAEIASAAGGVYFRQQVNTAVADAPITEALLPDNAVPEWWGPHLIAVTFWRRLTPERETPVIRHLERHEVIDKRCYVFHGLYSGSESRLGKPRPLQDGDAECVRLAALVNEQGAIETGSTILDVQYVPNFTPHRMLPGSPLGRSDYDSAEPFMDALDETWTSWMRDIRLGKGRLVVPRGYLRRTGAAGEGAYFDPEQEVFQAINTQVTDNQAGLSMSAVQFQIRVAEHAATTEAQWRAIYRAAGLDGNEQQQSSVAETATAVNSKASRKRSTRETKIRNFTPALRRMAQVLLELDVRFYGHAGVSVQPIDIEWPDTSSPPIETQAQTIQLLDAAKAISQRSKIKMLHPEWDKDQVDEEIQEIAADQPEPLSDPGTFTGADPAAPADPGASDGG